MGLEGSEGEIFVVAKSGRLNLDYRSSQSIDYWGRECRPCQKTKDPIEWVRPAMNDERGGSWRI